MIRVFIGCDSRQPLGYTVLQHSIQRHARGRVVVEPLHIDRLPIKRRGLTDFTYSRFLVPWLCDFEGVAIFMDADIVVNGDVAELAAQADGASSVQVMQEQPRFEWPSVMLFNNAHCKTITPDFVDDTANKLFDLAWGRVGTFSKEWNHCVNKVDPAEAKLYHFTEGLPCWVECQGSPFDEIWFDNFKDMQRTVGWKELMGTSVHLPSVLARHVANRFGVHLDIRPNA